MMARVFITHVDYTGSGLMQGTNKEKSSKGHYNTKQLEFVDEIQLSDWFNIAKF